MTVPPVDRYAGNLADVLRRELCSTNLPALLHYEDRNSMAFSIESRVPYLDVRLVEYVASLPLDQKIRNGVTKIALRNAVKGIIPESIRCRMDKMGFVTPEEIWMKDTLRPFVLDVLGADSFRARPYWDADAVMKDYQAFLDGKSAYSPEIWRIVCTELWLRKFLTGRQDPSVQSPLSTGLQDNHPDEPCITAGIEFYKWDLRTELSSIISGAVRKKAGTYGRIMKSIILAGGVGTRLWPLSREYYPKQFIQLDGPSLFQQTVERATRLSAPDEIYIVTNEIHRYLVRNQIEELGHSIADDHLLAEPAGKNTLPAIAWAMQRIRTDSPHATAVVFPSDHLLGETALDQIRAAEPLAKKNLVTFGIRPASPHTGYGYIRPGRRLTIGNVVDEFREKPDEKTAKDYVKKGYLWNSGIFLLSTDCFFGELKKYRPELYAAFTGDTPVNYAALESISIDYGLLEHSKRVAVVALDTAWSDLGTFKALYDVEQHDPEGMSGRRSSLLHAIILFMRRENMSVSSVSMTSSLLTRSTHCLSAIPLRPKR